MVARTPTLEADTTRSSRRGGDMGRGAGPELPHGLEAGDVVLFSRRCMKLSPVGAVLCLLAKQLSNSVYDHIGMVVRDPETGELLFLEADFGGVKLRSLDERLARSKAHTIAVRRLSTLRTTEFTQKVYDFATSMVGRGYNDSVGAMLATVIDPVSKQQRERLAVLLTEKKEQLADIDQELASSAGSVTAYTKRALLAERERVDKIVESLERALHQAMKGRESDLFESKQSDLTRVFCSELVAAAYQHTGLLDAYPPASAYTPKDFSMEQTATPNLHLLRRARLGPEILVVKDGAPCRSVRDVGTGNMPISSEAPDKEQRQFIREVLKKSPMQAAIPDPYKRSHFVKSFRPLRVGAGEVVFAQGDLGDKAFIIAQGSVDRFVLRPESDDPLLVSTLGSGNSFGVTSLMYNCPRSATLRAKEDCLLWQVDRNVFERFRDASADTGFLERFADTRKLRKYLSKHFLFSSLDKIGEKELGLFFTVKFRPSETIFAQGDPGDNFYIIKEGLVERHVNRPGGDPGRSDGNRVLTLRQGQSFGELALMYNAKRGASMKAVTDVECWAISSESFFKLYSGSAAQYMRAIFDSYASVDRHGELYMTSDDFLRFARLDKLPEESRDRLSTLLLALITSNRKKDSGRYADDPDDALFDFWEFVRFDIALNDPDVIMDFTFRLADRNNSGFVDLESLESLLADYTSADPISEKILYAKTLRKVFGKDGSKRLLFKEFQTLSRELLPSEFLQDMRLLSNHLLHHLDTPAQSRSSTISAESIGSLEDGIGISKIDLREDVLAPTDKDLVQKNLGAVFLSSILATTAVAPLKRLKVLMQTESLVNTSKREYSGLWQGLRRMTQQKSGGLAALYRGNSANVLRTAPAACIQLAAVELLRRSMSDREIASLPAFQGYEAVLLGGFAGVLATSITYPADLIHAQMSVGPKEVFREGIIGTARCIFQRDGLRGFVRGLLPTYIGVFPYLGINFGVYEMLRPALPKRNDGRCDIVEYFKDMATSANQHRPSREWTSFFDWPVADNPLPLLQLHVDSSRVQLRRRQLILSTPFAGGCRSCQPSRLTKAVSRR